MKYLSVCSGIEAATVAWHPLGWKPVAFSEIEPFPSAVLAHHYPQVPNLGDMTKHKEWNLGTIDLLVGGTPCQSFSVAGLRKGLDDPRGNLMLTYLAIADRNRPTWLVWENVPGVLSSNGGKDFGTFLGGLGELGYGFAYRVLDAQYFGVAQRRRRVFVVGYLGDWRPAAAVLFERESVCGNPAPSREKRQEVAGTFKACASSGGWSNSVDHAAAGYMQPTYGIPGNWIGRQPENGGNRTQFMEEVAPCLTSADKHGVAHTFDMKQHHNPQASDTVQLTTKNSAFVRGDTPLVAQPVPFQQTADCLTAAYGTKWNGNASATNGSLFVAQPIGIFQDSEFGVQQYNTAGTLRAGRIPEHQMALQPIAFQSVDFGADATINLSPTLRRHDPMAVAAFKYTMGAKARGIAYAEEQSPTFDTKPESIAVMHTAPTLTATNNPSRSPQSSEVTNQVAAVHAAAMAVRRLTPVECERLQGFPDNYTNIPWRKADQSPDGPRYKALGNSMAVPVMAWIGKRIAEYEQQAISG